MVENDLFSTSESDSFFISFTDIVTLLLIFFIYLVSISSFNVSEIEVLTKQIGSQFRINSIVEEITTKTDERVMTDPWMNIRKTIHNNLLPEETIRLSLDQELMFKPGSATLLQSGHGYLKQLADTLKDEPYQLIIEGHSDNTPIKSDIFPSNWHLSSMRAAEVTAVLQSYGIPGEHLSCRGFGETRPIVENASKPNDYKKNRRVQIYIKSLKQEASNE